MSDHDASMPHEPAPPEPRFVMPAADQLARGAALAGLAGGLGWLGWSAVRATWMLAPVAIGLVGVAALAAWAAAIHLTGGEKFDDHPFI